VNTFEKLPTASAPAQGAGEFASEPWPAAVPPDQRSVHDPGSLENFDTDVRSRRSARRTDLKGLGATE
jgi:hypothetical protein